MKDHDKTRSKIQGLILFEKHAGNNAVDSVEKAVEQRPVVKEEAAVATKRDKFPFAAFWSVEHSTAKGGIATA